MEIFAWLNTLSLTWWQSLIFFVVMLIGNLLKNKKFNIPITLTKKKKSNLIRCIDCVQILNNKSNELYAEHRRTLVEEDRLESSILRKQMNFAEEKLAEVEGNFLNFYNSLISIDDNEQIIGSEIKEYRMYWGLVKSCMRSIHDKIRIYFKENGFSEESGTDFSKNIKSKTRSIINVFDQEIINLYPKTEKMIVSSETILKFIQEESPNIEDIIFEIFIEAKRIKKETRDKIRELRDEYKKKHEQFNEEVEAYTKTLEMNRGC